jgi:hypothetical protein
MRRLLIAAALVAVMLPRALAEGEDAPKGTKIKGPHSSFSITIPEDWHHRFVESKVETEGETTELKVNALGKKLVPTDNVDVWWYEGEEPALEKGTISLHRVDLGREVTPGTMVDEIKKDETLPKDAKVTLAQVGKYVGLQVAVKVEEISTSTVTLANGKVAFVAVLMGPADVVKVQQPKFLKLLTTLETEEVKPAKLEDVLGVKPEEPLKPGQMKSKSGKFIVTVPDGWKHEEYDNPDDKPNAKLIMEAVPFEGALNITDNINFWWGPLGENMMGGLASLHRLEWVEGDAPTPKAIVDGLKASGKLPAGMEASLVQLGDYPAAIVGGPYQKIFYAAGVIVSEGKTLYLGSLLGPVAAVQPQWQNFTGLVSNLKTDDLKPGKVEDLK